jgi:NADH-quinone oxidoreductase subunit J
MIVTSLFFYIFALFAIGAAIGVVRARNPVHAVLSLILVFLNAAGLFLLLNAEFIALSLIIVYVGAVAVLFLFIVMMLDIKIEAMLRSKNTLFMYVLLLLVLAADFCIILKPSEYDLMANHSMVNRYIANGVSNTNAIGRVLYTDFIYPFQVGGLVLLVAMVSAIVLTLRDRPGVKKQNPYEQSARNAKDTVVNVKVKVGEGVEYKLD